jgi:hypothetical protein
VDPNAVEIWTRAGGLRCVTRPRGTHWELALMRQQWVVKVDMFVDAGSALAAADEWRRALERAPDEGMPTPTSSGNGSP